MGISTINKLKSKVVEIVETKKEGHLLSSWSVIPILWILYKHVVRQRDFLNPGLDDDLVLLSKGHGALGWYVVLNEIGVISRIELDAFSDPGSNLGGHPDARKIPWATASTGSLGHGLPISIGLQYVKNESSGNKRVYCLMGDGECMEGTFWESLLLSKKLELRNLVLIVDFNSSHPMGPSIEILNSIAGAFGWNFVEVFTSDLFELKEAFENLPSDVNSLVVCKSIRGEGVSTVQGKPEWHHKVPTKEESIQIISELSI